MPVGLQIFEVARVNAIMQGFQDVNQMEQGLRFLQRTAMTPALDGEIMARVIGTVQIADLVADDQAAAVYQADHFQLESYPVPNLKVGISVNQSMLNQLFSIGAAGVQRDEEGVFSNYELRTIRKARLGVQQRQEALIISMFLDGFSYDRLGIKMNGVTWGMPSALKVTLTGANTWDNPTTATPVADLLNLKQQGEYIYGEDFDRITLSRTAFNYMTATTEFQNRARWVLPAGLSAASIPTMNIDDMRQLAMRILGVGEIELYNTLYWTQGSNGTIVGNRFLPANKVILSSTQDDNNADAYDFANGVVTESLVSSLVNGGTMIGKFNVPMRGPAAYATLANAQMNPPGVNYWGVARGFPRKKRLQMNAVLTVGSYPDPAPTTLPF